MTENFKIYCPDCGKMLCTIEDNSTVEIQCTRGCGVFRITTKNGEITTKLVKKKKKDDR